MCYVCVQVCVLYFVVCVCVYVRVRVCTFVFSILFGALQHTTVSIQRRGFSLCMYGWMDMRVRAIHVFSFENEGAY